MLICFQNMCKLQLSEGPIQCLIRSNITIFKQLQINMCFGFHFLAKHHHFHKRLLMFLELRHFDWFICNCAVLLSRITFSAALNIKHWKHWTHSKQCECLIRTPKFMLYLFIPFFFFFLQKSPFSNYTILTFCVPLPKTIETRHL